MQDHSPWEAHRFDPAKFAAVAADVQQRVTTLADVPHVIDWLFLEEPVHDEDSWDKAMGKDGVAAVLDGGHRRIGGL